MKSSTRSALVVAAALAFASLGGGIAFADDASTTSCVLRADPPNTANDAIVGREGCASNIPVTGYIKEDRNNWGDDTVGSRSFTGGIAWVYGSCGNGSGYYYSQVNSSSGATAQSARRYRCS
ncbi:MAG: hypothetical protein ACRDT8_23670 [Micromonosporaceae bacterium]